MVQRRNLALPPCRRRLRHLRRGAATFGDGPEAAERLLQGLPQVPARHRRAILENKGELLALLRAGVPPAESCVQEAKAQPAKVEAPPCPMCRQPPPGDPNCPQCKRRAGLIPPETPIDTWETIRFVASRRDDPKSAPPVAAAPSPPRVEAPAPAAQTQPVSAEVRGCPMCWWPPPGDPDCPRCKIAAEMERRRTQPQVGGVGNIRADDPRLKDPSWVSRPAYGR